MTEKEILDRQEQNGNREFYLMLIGRFYHAYGNGAFALARLTGYRVRRVNRKMGELYVLGFPIDRFDSVRDKVCDAGGDVECVDGKIWKFSGLDGTPDLTMVKETVADDPVPAPHLEGAGEASPHSWLEDAVRHFDLSMATPMDAMLFLSQLKQRLLREAAEH